MKLRSVIYLCFTLALSAIGAYAAETAGMTFRAFSVEGKSLQGQLAGPWEWTGGVTVKAEGLTLTCDALKLWPSADGREADRAEASGNVNIEGRYVSAEGVAWSVSGRAASASYERKTGQSVLRGAVSFRATNTKTGAVMSAAAEKLIYNSETKQFRFERGDAPVRMEWQEPTEEGKSQKEKGE